MQFIENIIGSGSDKKIVRLAGANAPIDYLCAQALDIMHDAKIDGASMQHIALVVGLIVHWICAHNNLDLETKARLCDRVVRRLQILGGGRILDVKRAVANITQEYISVVHARHATMTIMSHDDLARIIVDSCGTHANAGAATRVVGCDTSRAILTWSVMYDGGANEAYCKDARGRCIGLAPMDGLREVARATEMSQKIMDRLSLFSLSVCANHRNSSDLATNAYDMCIVANLSDLIGAPIMDGANYQVVLASRGCGLTTTERVGASTSVPRASIGFFALQSFPGETIIIARSPPASETARIVSSFVNIAHTNIPIALATRAYGVVTPQNERAMMRAYSMLVAKHWGDLGLVIDARCANAVVFTSDGVVCACCAMLGVTSILDGTMIRASPNVPPRHSQVTETNSGTIFGRPAVL